MRRRYYIEDILDDIAPRKIQIAMPSNQRFMAGDQVAYVGTPTTVKSDNVVTITNGELKVAGIRDFAQFNPHQVHARLTNGDAVELNELVRTDQKFKP